MSGAKHTEGPWECPLCQKRFTIKSAASDHIRDKHGTSILGKNPSPIKLETAKAEGTEA